MLETRVDLSNDMTWRQMIVGVGVRNVVLRRVQRAREAARARDRQRRFRTRPRRAMSPTEDETAGERTRTRVGRPRGGMKVAARIGEGLRREIGRGRRPRVGEG